MINLIGVFVILILITGQRLGELRIAERNTARLLAKGGVESGANHYPLIVALHSLWLLGLWILAWRHPVSVFWLLIYLVIQSLRIWVLMSLGERWTTRIITVPGETLVRRGPYRFLSHPNYIVVAAEIVVAPLIFGLPVFAAVFFLFNAAVLTVRIREEEAALGLATSEDQATSNVTAERP